MKTYTKEEYRDVYKTNRGIMELVFNGKIIPGWLYNEMCDCFRYLRNKNKRPYKDCPNCGGVGIPPIPQSEIE